MMEARCLNNTIESVAKIEPIFPENITHECPWYASIKEWETVYVKEGADLKKSEV